MGKCRNVHTCALDQHFLPHHDIIDNNANVAGATTAFPAHRSLTDTIEASGAQIPTVYTQSRIVNGRTVTRTVSVLSVRVIVQLADGTTRVDTVTTFTFSDGTPPDTVTTPGS